MSFNINSYWVHRTFCDAAEDARKMIKRINIWNFVFCREFLKASIEEIQSHGDRMEAALEYTRDINKLKEKRDKLIKEVEELNKKLPEDKALGDDI